VWQHPFRRPRHKGVSAKPAGTYPSPAHPLYMGAMVPKQGRGRGWGLLTAHNGPFVHLEQPNPL
jgi:hypothetical protein